MIRSTFAIAAAAAALAVPATSASADPGDFPVCNALDQTPVFYCSPPVDCQTPIVENEDEAWRVAFG